MNTIPQNLISPSGAQTPDTIAVVWDKNKSAKSYRIYVDGEFAGKTTATDYTLSGLECDTEYKIYVRSELENGELSDKSNEILVSTDAESEILNIMQFGAMPDGRTVNTKAIQQAIDSCHVGGTVYVPEGTFVSGAIYLKSNMTLCVDGVLMGSGDIKDYPIMKYRFEGLETACYASLINTTDGEKENIKITGNGTIDANGVTLFEQEMKENKGKRGRAICIRSCKNLYMKDITVRQSPAWCVHFIYCDGASFNNIKIHTRCDEDGNIYGHIFNGDGLDPDSSKNVYIFNCMIASQDDCVAIKSGKDEEGRRVGISTENVRVTNCHFKSGFGVVVGSEMSGSVRNVLVQDCVFENTYSVVSIKTPRGRGAVVENIHYENNTHYNHDTAFKDCEWFRGAIYIDQFYSHVTFDVDAKEEITDATPVIRNILIENITTETVTGNAIYLTGLPEMPLENITLRNVTAKGKYGLKANNINGLTLDNVSVKSNEDDDYQFKNVVRI